MAESEVARRLAREARIAANLGSSFGQGGEGFMRFNIAAPRSLIEEAVERLRLAFADVQ
jgi:cystathionine beta-lyase